MCSQTAPVCPPAPCHGNPSRPWCSPAPSLFYSSLLFHSLLFYNACPSLPEKQADLRELHGIFDRFLAAKEPTAAALHRLAPLLYHLVAISVLSPSAGCRLLLEHTPLDPERWRVIYGILAIMAGSESCPAAETTATMAAVLQRLSATPAPATDAKTQCGMLAAEVSVGHVGRVMEIVYCCGVAVWLWMVDDAGGQIPAAAVFPSDVLLTSMSASRRLAAVLSSNLQPPTSNRPRHSCFSSCAASSKGRRRDLPTWVMSAMPYRHGLLRAIVPATSFARF